MITYNGLHRLRRDKRILDHVSNEWPRPMYWPICHLIYQLILYQVMYGSILDQPSPTDPLWIDTWLSIDRDFDQLSTNSQPIYNITWPMGQYLTQSLSIHVLIPNQVLPDTSLSINVSIDVSTDIFNLVNTLVNTSIRYMIQNV